VRAGSPDFFHAIRRGRSVEPAAWGAGFPLSVTLGATCLSLSISDTNKELLLRSSFDNIGGQGSGGDHEHTFISHVLTGLGFEL
jgi:hypothetical protein